MASETELKQLRERAAAIRAELGIPAAGAQPKVSGDTALADLRQRSDAIRAEVAAQQKKPVLTIPGSRQSLSTIGTKTPKPATPIAAAEGNKDRQLSYTDQKNMDTYSGILSKQTMPGQSHSVLDEVKVVSSMADGEAKETRKKELLKQLKKAINAQNWQTLVHPLNDGWDQGDVMSIFMEGINRATTADKFNEKDLYALLTGQTRDADFWDVTLNSFTRGYNNSRYGEESYNAMMGAANEKEKYERILSGDDYNFEAGNWLERGVAGVSAQIGQQVRQWTNPTTLAAVGTAAGAAALAGQAGPQVAAPEEIITVPAAALFGLKAGSAMSSLQIEAGLAYNEMLEAGVSEETARKIALGVGTVNAGLDALQLDELLDAYKVTKATGATKSVTKKILEELGKRGIDVVKETAEEVGQEAVTMGGVQLGSKIDTGKDAYTWDEAGNRLWDTAKSSALTFGLMNTPAAVRNSVSIGLDQKKQVAMHDTTTSQNPTAAPQTAVNKTGENGQPQTQTAPTQAVTARDPIQKTMDVVNSTVAQLNGDPANPLETAVTAFRENGTVSNKLADAISRSPDAVRTLVNEVGLRELPRTASEKRAAIKQAVIDYAQKQTPAADESTSVNTDPTQHTPQEQAVIDEYQNAVDPNLVSYIEQIKENPGKKIGRYTLKTVSDRAAADIKSLTGVDVSGSKMQIEGKTINHILKRHGKNGKADSTMNDVNDIARMQYVLDNYDDVELGGKVQGYRYLDKNGNLVPAQAVIFSKKVNGTYYVVEAIPDSERKTVFVASAYMSKNGHKNSAAAPLVGDAEAYRVTSETKSKSTAAQPGTEAPMNTVAQPADFVNPLADGQGVNSDSKKAKVAKVLRDNPHQEKANRGLWSWTKEKVFDKGMVFENLALKTNNRELQAKWNATRYAQSRAQWLIGNGSENIKPLNEIRDEVESTGASEKFSNYLYHKHNIDRMQLEARYESAKNKPVFGDAVTAEVSQRYVEQYEKENPSFVRLAEDVYAYMNHLRQLLVDNSVISQDTADLWAQMYPHYVPIHRVDDAGRGVDVPLDTGRTGVNAPVKKATGGNGDILPLFDTMAQRTLQTYTAIARNSFGVELKNTLESVVSRNTATVDDAIDSVEAQDGLLQEGKNGTNPTFTVFENGERITFEVTKEMYDALKPKSEAMSYTNTVANAISNFHRGVLTEYNPTFMLTNAIKDVQDVLINSQHPAKTYAKIPQAYAELAKKGKWYREYAANGGEQNTYFNSDTNNFGTEDKGLKKLQDVPPLSTIRKLNSFIEMAPRLAEYIASREAGKSIDVAMLDAARVTTNFAAGGDLTKLLDRNGATFLNASVQGVVQQARNIREAKANGWKGWVGLAARFALAGLPEVLLNGLIWDDDEDYAELSDYVKDNYYIIWKYDDGQFVKIPKGRVTAVIQGAVRQIVDTATGDDDADWERFIELVGSNIAPNNPFESNIISPIKQVADNKTWYGEDLVPARLQDLPAAEQYDESTDALSKWLGEKLNVSPVKINYLLNQYGGGVADTFLPMLTPKAESGDDSLIGNALAPLKDKFTTDSVMNNQSVTDFYNKLEELTTNAKASNATVEDKIAYKYINSVNSQLRDLYAEKRKVQSSNLSDDEKYAKVRSIQQKITDAARKALESCGNPYSADKSGSVAGVMRDSFSELTDCWKSGADTSSTVATIEQAYGAYCKMDVNGKERVKAEGGRVEDYLAARESGVTTKTFVDLFDTYCSIDMIHHTASSKASQWAYVLEKAQEKGTITQAQKNTLKEEMNFWQMIPSETARFDELVDSGLSADKADFITQLLDGILPGTGSSSVKPIQRITAIANADDRLSEADQKTAMKSVLDDKGYEKYLRVLALGLDTDDYADSYRTYLEAEGNGKKARTIAQFQKELDIPYSTAKTLYEIYCPPAK